MLDAITFIKKKDELLEKDYKFRFIFENTTVIQNRELYHKKSAKLEEKIDMPDIAPKKMRDFFKNSCIKTWKKDKITGIKTIHCASLSGFSETDIAFIGEIHTNDSVEIQASNFLNAFEKIVSDKNVIPNKTVIILSTDEHHMTKMKRYGSVLRSTEKKRKIAAECKGQQTIKTYFKSVKNPTQNETSDKEPINFKVEEIITRLRGNSSEIEVLWCPNIELNPCSYVSVLFNNEVMRYLETNRKSSLFDACHETVNTIPSSVWSTYHEFIKDLEYTLLEEYELENKLKENEIPITNKN